MKRLVMVVVVGLTMTMVSMTAAAGEQTPNENSAVERNEDVPFFLHVYDPDEGITVLGGPPVEEGCRGQGFVPTLDEQLNELPNDVTVSRISGEQHLHVVAGTIREVCTAVLNGEDPPLLADGMGHVVGTNNDGDASGTRTRSFGLKATGQLTDPDGGRCGVRVMVRLQMSRAGDFRVLAEDVRLTC